MVSVVSATILVQAAIHLAPSLHYEHCHESDIQLFGIEYYTFFPEFINMHLGTEHYAPRVLLHAL